MASPTIQFKRGLFVNLPSLLSGEPGFTTDRSDLYIGDGSGNKFFGSHRYWTREDGTNALQLKLVDKDGNNGVSLRAPATVGTAVTYTLPEGGGATGNFLKLGASGVLEWASVTSGANFDSVQIANSTFSGISTFSGLVDANGGLDVSGHSELDNVNISGLGTIATADINGGNIDGTVIGASSAAAGTFTHVAYDSSSTTGISTVGSLYAGSDKVLSVETGDLTLSNIDAIDATTKATLEATLALDPNDFDSLNVTGISTIGGLLDANAGLDVTGHSELDTVNVSGVSTFTGSIDANGGVTGDLTGNADTASSLATARTISLSGDVVGSTSFDGSANVSIAATIQPNSVGLGTDTTGNYVATITGTANEIAVSGSGSETAAVTLSLPDDVIVATSVKAPTLKTAAITHSDGASAFTIDASGNVGVATNLTVNGDLSVLGTTTTVNTETLLVKDSLIEVGMVDDNGDLVAPSSDANIDVGMVFHYYSGSAKKAAVYWDDSTSRIAFASDASESNSVISATTYATILAGGLEINNSCTGGTDEVISCVGESLALSNVVIDGGSF